jgi:hypothetical protein
MKEYRNSHTTSTKCQYQAEHSNPTKDCLLKEGSMFRVIDTSKNTVPMITWSPWNPVAIKNLEP